MQNGSEEFKDKKRTSDYFGGRSFIFREKHGNSFASTSKHIMCIWISIFFGIVIHRPQQRS